MWLSNFQIIVFDQIQNHNYCDFLIHTRQVFTENKCSNIPLEKMMNNFNGQPSEECSHNYDKDITSITHKQFINQKEKCVTTYWKFSKAFYQLNWQNPNIKKT